LAETKLEQGVYERRRAAHRDTLKINDRTVGVKVTSGGVEPSIPR